MTQPDATPEDPSAAGQFVDPELDGTNAAIARDMREAAEASRSAASAELDE